MIICISGKARSGKDTFADMLAESLNNNGYGIFILMAFAHELKLGVQREFDLSYAQLWGDKKEVEDKRYPKPDGNGFWTGREMMQNYGQFFRTIESGFWIRKLFDVIDDKEYNNVIITDARHPNEVDAVVNKGGYHIKIVRPDKEEVHNQKHISETALEEDYKVDIKILNDRTLEELKTKSEDVVKTLMSMESLRKSLKEK
jgi:hypothetical protein